MKNVRWWVVAVMALCALTVVGCAKKTTKVAKKGPDGLQRIHFDFDKSDIKAEYEPVIKANAEWLKNNEKKSIAIEGNCDERGSAEYNVALGDRRANAAKKYLKNLGISEARLNTVSYGEERPAATCHDESCWWQNRRAEFKTK